MHVDLRHLSAEQRGALAVESLLADCSEAEVRRRALTAYADACLADPETAEIVEARCAGRGVGRRGISGPSETVAARGRTR